MVVSDGSGHDGEAGEQVLPLAVKQQRVDYASGLPRTVSTKAHIPGLQEGLMI